VVEVQVRAHDGVDGLRRKARGGEILQESRLQIAEHRKFTLPVRADAGVDHHALVARARLKAWKDRIIRPSTWRKRGLTS
jgi:hypothetical protein